MNITLPTNGGLLNPNFRYVPSDKTDIRQRFDEVRRLYVREGIRSWVILSEQSKKTR